MKVAVIFNKRKKTEGEGVINVFGAQNQETYNPKPSSVWRRHWSRAAIMYVLSMAIFM